MKLKNPYIFFFTLLLGITLFPTNILSQNYSKDDPYLVTLDVNDMRDWARNAPMEFTSEANSKIIILDLPMPGGEMVSVKIIESPVVERYNPAAEMKTYSFTSVDDPLVHGRLSLSPLGLDAYIVTPQGDYFIGPKVNYETQHMVYKIGSQDFPHSSNDAIDPTVPYEKKSNDEYEHRHHENEEIHSHEIDEAFLKTLPPAFNIGGQVREFDMHVIADAQYSIAVCGVNPTRTCVDMKIESQVNLMNVKYIRDMAVKLKRTNNSTIYLTVASNPSGFAAPGGTSNPDWIFESLVHHKFMITNTTSDGSGGTNAMVPLTSYDVGHLFSGRVGMGLGGGGAAFLNSVCNDTEITVQGNTGPQKAGGGSGVPNPQGGGWIDLLAHEFTHQFNAPHSWNGAAGNCTTDQFGPAAAFEPGGGSTIVSYADICAPQNIPNQGNTSYYHFSSIEAVNNHIANTNCVTNVPSGNSVPVVSTSTTGCTPNYNIPTQTPFEVTGSATDANDPIGNLTYTWEQRDAGTRSNPINASTTNSTTLPSDVAPPDPTTPPANYSGEPLFRSYFPSSSAQRTFPSLTIIKSNKYNADQTAAALTLSNWQGELLSEVARTINLRLTVRDNNTTAGGVEHQDLAINVVNTGAPFKVTAPDGGQTLTAGNVTTVTWNVSGTTAAPISCANVNIRLSTDGGMTFPITLGSFPNNGSASITLPSSTPNTTTARIRVECGTDCFKFFDISNTDFTITSNCTASASNICPINSMTLPQGDPGLNLSMENHYGGIVTSKAFNIMATSPTGPLANATTSGGTTCQTPFGTEKYQMFDFVPSKTGSYTFTKDAPLAVFSIFTAAGYNPAMPCSGTFIGSNSTGAISASSSATVNLTACTKYKLVVWSVNGANITSNITFSGTGSIYESNTAPTNTAYTYVAVNTSNNQIVAQSATTNFSALTAGTYKIYGANYKSSGTTPPAVVDPATLVGQTLAGAASSNCVVFSANCKTLTVTGGTPTCSISAISTSNLSACNVGPNTFTANVIVTFANAPTSGMLDLTGDGTASVAVGSLGSSTSHTFMGVTMPADGGAINLVATFSAMSTCSFTNSDAGTAPTCTPPCSITNVAAGTAACSGTSATFTVTGTVANGSGNYNVVNIANNAVLGSITGGTMNGALSIPATFAGATGQTIMVNIVDTGVSGCAGIAVSITLPDCSCTPTITCPNPGTFNCGDDTAIAAWLASATSNPCSQIGTTVTTNYNAANFNKCSTITNNITFSLKSSSGTTLADCVVALTINAAPAVTITAPTLPTTLTCQTAQNYTAPAATFTNGLTGTCANTGMLTGTITNSSAACGGTITVNYSGQDDCGNTLSAGPFTIQVAPAPAPTVTAPSLPPSVSCTTADGYSPPTATYTNGLAGTCNISGNLTGTVSNFWNSCGGFMLINYNGTTSCGQTISLPSITIQVQAAPIPTIALPTLPSSISCEAAGAYNPPNATATNGLTGNCNISGNVSVLVNYFYDACGGTLEIIYSGQDVCGRNLAAMVGIINVDPAPVPTIMIPSFPTSISCSDAQNFEAPYTTYDNGLTGDCNISGLIQPEISLNVDACSGGTMTIQYHGFDDCGNLLTANPIIVLVDPAPVAVLSPPFNIPNTIYCWEAEGFSAGNAIFNNGNIGACGNSGEIEPLVTELWNNCDGGIIFYEYLGTDNCGNVLNPVVLKVSVLPDVWAPEGGCAPLEETIALIEDVPHPDEMQYYFDQIAAGYYDDCGDVVVAIIDDTGNPECDEQGFFERIYTVEITDKCGNVAGECSITFSGNCNQYICTMTQKFYGNPVDELFGVSSAEIVNSLIDAGNNPIIVGDGDCGITLDNTQCIQTMLNTYGASVSLPSGFAGACDGTNNALVNQIITTTLNIRYNQMLNPNGQIDLGGVLLDDLCMNIPGFILNDLSDNPTVNDLLKYANDFIACQCTLTCGEFQPNMAELTNIFWGISSRFNRCQMPGPCTLFNEIPNNGQDASTNNISIELYPNPTKDLINLKLVDGFGKTCTLEIFDALGQKVGEKTYLNLDQNILQLDVNDYQNGIHWITINLEGFDQMTKKFLIVK